MVAFTEGLCLKGVPFSGFNYMKGQEYMYYELKGQKNLSFKYLKGPLLKYFETDIFRLYHFIPLIIATYQVCERGTIFFNGKYLKGVSVFVRGHLKMGKGLDLRVEHPCIKLCRVPFPPQPAILHPSRRLLLGNLGQLKCGPFFIFICKRRNKNIINLNWINVLCFQIRCHNRQQQDFNSQDLEIIFSTVSAVHFTL